MLCKWQVKKLCISHTVIHQGLLEGAVQALKSLPNAVIFPDWSYRSHPLSFCYHTSSVHFSPSPSSPFSTLSLSAPHPCLLFNMTTECRYLNLAPTSLLIWWSLNSQEQRMMGNKVVIRGSDGSSRAIMFPSDQMLCINEIPYHRGEEQDAGTGAGDARHSFILFPGMKGRSAIHRRGGNKCAASSSTVNNVLLGYIF